MSRSAPLPLIDLDQARRSLARARRLRKPGADFLLMGALEDLTERLAATPRRFDNALATGPFAVEVADALAATEQVARVTVHPGGLTEDLRIGAAEHDLAVSIYHLHQANDVTGLMIQHRLALRPDGLFLACAAGAGTLNELRQSLLAAESSLSGGVHARVLPLMDVRDAGALLQRAGFALPVADADTVTVRHSDALALMHDLRAMGATNSLTERPRSGARRAMFMEAMRLHQQDFGDDDGRVRSTFATVWISGWAPGPDQPKALKPGSATVSLADVLGPFGDR